MQNNVIPLLLTLLLLYASLILTHLSYMVSNIHTVDNFQKSYTYNQALHAYHVLLPRYHELDRDTRAVTVLFPSLKKRLCPKPFLKLLLRTIVPTWHTMGYRPQRQWSTRIHDVSSSIDQKKNFWRPPHGCWLACRVEVGAGTPLSQLFRSIHHTITRILALQTIARARIVGLLPPRQWTLSLQPGFPLEYR